MKLIEIDVKDEHLYEPYIAGVYPDYSKYNLSSCKYFSKEKVENGWDRIKYFYDKKVEN